MIRLRKFGGLVLSVSILALAVLAQTDGLPRIKKGENYKSERVKMIKAGWQPHPAEDADRCLDGDERCQNRPEMQSCAGTGEAPCRFLWKREAKTVVIFTVGENTTYKGHEFQ